MNINLLRIHSPLAYGVGEENRSNLRKFFFSRALTDCRKEKENDVCVQAKDYLPDYVTT